MEVASFGATYKHVVIGLLGLQFIVHFLKALEAFRRLQKVVEQFLSKSRAFNRYRREAM